MSTATVHQRRRRRPARLFASISFTIMVGGWLCFLAALMATQETLDDVWTAVRDLPIVLEGVVWLLAFPFLVGLAIWQAAWDEAVRLTAIAVLALAYIAMFVPRQRRL